MTIKKLYFIIYSIIGIVLFSLGLTIVLVLQNQQALNESQLIRFQSYLLANELRQSSDELTTMARSYVATKDHQYEQKYWDILAVRNGEKPRPDSRTVSLKTLMKEAGFTSDEFAKLQEAEDKSNGLVRTETIAMNAVKGLYDDGKGTFAKGQSSDSLLANSAMRSIDSDQAYAIRLMFDENYHAEKVKISRPIDEFTQLLTKRTEDTVAAYVAKGNWYLTILVTLFFILLGVIVFSYLAIQRKVISRLVLLTRLTENAQRMSAGDFSTEVSIVSKDEIGQLAEAVNSLSSGLKEKADFALAIGKGNLEAAYQPLGDKDALGLGLLEMRDNLQKVAQEDKKRQWAAEGLARMGEIIRSEKDLNAHADSIMASLVKYMHANQGGFFIVNDMDKNNTYLEMIACYAYDRKKFINKKVDIGEGLVGQCYLEKDTIYLTAIPDDYINITSGLGNANPRSIIIVPLINNDTIEGVIELASFQEMADFEIAFLQKVAESIASSLAGAKVNERTKQLLAQAQQQAEELRAAEEEMRQNMEELSATQEETHRKEKAYLEKIEEMHLLLSSHNIPVNLESN